MFKKNILRFINYFFFKPLLLFFLELSPKVSNRIFVHCFNLYSFFLNSKNRITLKENYFYNSELKWRFNSKQIGLYFYGKGFKSRIESLSESYLINNLEFKDDDIIIDVGANNGDFFLCFEKKIKYYGFEPSPIVFSNLQFNIGNEHNLFNIAISDKNENVTFYLSDNHGDSSILEIENYEQKITIPSKSLDSVIDEIDNKIKLIKLEAEGYEPEILYGLSKNLYKVKYISIDCGFERGKERKSTLGECSNYLIKRGFSMIDFGKSRVVALYKNTKFQD